MSIFLNLERNFSL